MALFFCSLQKALLMTFNIPLRHPRKWNVRCRSPVLWCLWVLSQRCRWLLENKASSIFTLSITLNGVCMGQNKLHFKRLLGRWPQCSELTCLGKWATLQMYSFSICVRSALGSHSFWLFAALTSHSSFFHPVAIGGSLSSEMKRQREGGRGRVRRIKASKRRRRADVPRFQEAESDGEQGKAEGTRHVGRRQE